MDPEILTNVHVFKANEYEKMAFEMPPMSFVFRYTCVCVAGA
jgi:hypothetical protein